jgi:hypothetical protein
LLELLQQLAPMVARGSALPAALPSAAALAVVRLARGWPGLLPLPRLVPCLHALANLGVEPKSARWRGELQACLTQRIQQGHLNILQKAKGGPPPPAQLAPLLAVMVPLLMLRCQVGGALHAAICQEATQRLCVLAALLGPDRPAWQRMPAVKARSPLTAVVVDVVSLMQFMTRLGMPGSLGLVEQLLSVLQRAAQHGALQPSTAHAALVQLRAAGVLPPPRLLALLLGCMLPSPDTLQTPQQTGSWAAQLEKDVAQLRYPPSSPSAVALSRVCAQLQAKAGGAADWQQALRQLYHSHAQERNTTKTADVAADLDTFIEASLQSLKQSTSSTSGTS